MFSHKSPRFDVNQENKAFNSFYDEDDPKNAGANALTVKTADVSDPTGSKPYYAVAENIAFGFTTNEDVVESWKETAEPYAGQGHRRNMLRATATCIGIACFEVNGVRFWVQEFGDKSSGQKARAAKDGSENATVSVLPSNVKSVAIQKNRTLLHLR